MDEFYGVVHIDLFIQVAFNDLEERVVDGFQVFDNESVDKLSDQKVEHREKKDVRQQSLIGSVDLIFNDRIEAPADEEKQVIVQLSGDAQKIHAAVIVQAAAENSAFEVVFADRVVVVGKAVGLGIVAIEAGDNVLSLVVEQVEGIVVHCHRDVGKQLGGLSGLISHVVVKLLAVGCEPSQVAFRILSGCVNVEIDVHQMVDAE